MWTRKKSLVLVDKSFAGLTDLALVIGNKNSEQTNPFRTVVENQTRIRTNYILWIKLKVGSALHKIIEGRKSSSATTLVVIWTMVWFYYDYIDETLPIQILLNLTLIDCSFVHSFVNQPNET